MARKIISVVAGAMLISMLIMTSWSWFDEFIPAPQVSFLPESTVRILVNLTGLMFSTGGWMFWLLIAYLYLAKNFNQRIAALIAGVSSALVDLASTSSPILNNSIALFTSHAEMFMRIALLFHIFAAMYYTLGSKFLSKLDSLSLMKEGAIMTNAANRSHAKKKNTKQKQAKPRPRQPQPATVQAAAPLGRTQGGTGE